MRFGRKQITPFRSWSSFILSSNKNSHLLVHMWQRVPIIVLDGRKQLWGASDIENESYFSYKKWFLGLGFSWHWHFGRRLARCFQFKRIHCFCFCLFLLHCVPCRILVPQPGIEPPLPAAEAQSLTPGPPGKSQRKQFKFLQHGTVLPILVYNLLFYFSGPFAVIGTRPRINPR